MKLITKKTDYAARALSFIAKKEDGSATASELAARLKIPQPFLRGLLQELSLNGLVISYKGKGGGFSLARPADRIHLTDIIKALQGQVRLRDCVIKKRLCPDVRRCILRKKIMTLERHIEDELGAITIKDLAGDIC